MCDYEQVTAAGEKLVAAANDLVQDATTYVTNMGQDISAWSGMSKDTFVSQSNGRTQLVGSKAQRMSEFGEYVKGVSKAIQELDDTLAGITI